jgi:hypothetical protein
MKRITAILGALVLAVSLSGCGTLFADPTDIKVSEELSAAGQVAQKSVNTARVFITAAANVVTANVKEGITTKAEGLAYADKLDAYSLQADAVQALIDAGDPLAGSKADLLERALLALHREVAAKARKERQ